MQRSFSSETPFVLEILIHTRHVEIDPIFPRNRLYLCILKLPRRTPLYLEYLQLLRYHLLDKTPTKLI